MSGKDKGLFLVYRTRLRLDIVSALLLICLKFIFMDHPYLWVLIDFSIELCLPLLFLEFILLRPGSPSNLQHF